MIFEDKYVISYDLDNIKKSIDFYNSKYRNSWLSNYMPKLISSRKKYFSSYKQMIEWFDLEYAKKIEKKFLLILEKELLKEILLDNNISIDSDSNKPTIKQLRDLLESNIKYIANNLDMNKSVVYENIEDLINNTYDDILEELKKDEDMDITIIGYKSDKDDDYNHDKFSLINKYNIETCCDKVGISKPKGEEFFRYIPESSEYQKEVLLNSYFTFNPVNKLVIRKKSKELIIKVPLGTETSTAEVLYKIYHNDILGIITGIGIIIIKSSEVEILDDIREMFKTNKYIRSSNL